MQVKKIQRMQAAAHVLHFGVQSGHHKGTPVEATIENLHNHRGQWSDQQRGPQSQQRVPRPRSERPDQIINLIRQSRGECVA